MLNANTAPADIKREVSDSYASLPDLVDSAMELAEEVKNQQDRLSCVMLKLLDHLSPPDGEESRDLVAQRLAELLYELMADARRENYLIDAIHDVARVVRSLGTAAELEVAK